METQDLAKKLKDLRVKRGMSQEYLADESQVSLRTIQRIENNESKPTGETIKRIANALGVKLNELIDSNLANETNDLDATLVFLKKQLSKAHEKSEIKTFEKFIELLQRLKEKEITSEQLERIETYIQYLELEKIPSFSKEIYNQKLAKFKKYLKNKLGFVPKNYYTTRTASFGIAFAIGIAFQNNLDVITKIGMLSAALLLIAIGIIIDRKIKKQERSFSF
ncbi:helix-turn-helix transcriptional regulator [Mangrovivirga sp. M17]|uniref:Helix-turn-helix transcriptional regulator n=1 Tax=Mangrovivirga halotolerans TaxID=2993936 RepID=A0ABT3RV21_9BACT|nr:helix-turn-helix transcriptional regulator [Mangrovivirga halotolerans]MCX2745628.1 helix-turn-helix transcriptional regulator [Mangrovivirga halotolerans]